MFQMSYPYSPLGDRRFGANIPAADLGNRERNNTSSCFRVQLEQIDMNATPVIEVDRPHENDVLMGRGGKNNQHSGNEKLRQIAKEHCIQYNESSKKEKSSISRRLVEYMRELEPPARFLKRDSITGKWTDVGDDIAREKASQVLRDAVALLLEAETGENSGGEDLSKSTNFSKPLDQYATARRSTAWEDRTEYSRSSPPGRYASSTSYAATHSSTPIPVEYATRPDNKRPRYARYEDDVNRRGRPYSYAPASVSFEERHYDYDATWAANTVRRKASSSDATMIRHYAVSAAPPSSAHYGSSSSRYSTSDRHPLPSPARSSFQISRLPLHRRRSSATEGSYNEFDLFNGQLLESDTEDRGVC